MISTVLLVIGLAAWAEAFRGDFKSELAGATNMKVANGEYVPATPGPAPLSIPYSTFTPQPIPTPPATCMLPMQVCIAAQVDSGSIDAWDNATRWIEKFIQITKEENPERNITWGGVAFESAIYGPAQFTQDSEAIVQFFKAIPFKQGGARIDKALRICRNMHGGWNFDVLKLTILITDGNGTKKDGSTRSFSATRKQAHLLRDSWSHVYVLGNPAPTEKEPRLRKITGKWYPSSERFLYQRMSKYTSAGFPGKKFRKLIDEIGSCHEGPYGP